VLHILNGKAKYFSALKIEAEHSSETSAVSCIERYHMLQESSRLVGSKGTPYFTRISIKQYPKFVNTARIENVKFKLQVYMKNCLSVVFLKKLSAVFYIYSWFLKMLVIILCRTFCLPGCYPKI